MNGPKRCKFGPNCKRLADGSCTYFHPPEDFQGGGNYMQNPSNKSGGYSGGGNPNYNVGGNSGYGGGNPNNNPKQKWNNYNNQSNYGGGNPSYNDGGNPNYNKGGNPNYNKPPTGDDFTNKFCRQFQLNNQCKFNDNCKRKHGFDLQDKIKRIQFDKNIPHDMVSKLTVFTADKKFFALRMGGIVNFFTYNVESNQLADVGQWELPKVEGNIHYYNQKNQWIYFAYDNQKTGFSDFGVYDIMNKSIFHIENAHENKITGLGHYNQSVMLTTSLDGCLKTWKIEGNKLVYDAASTEMLRKNYWPDSSHKIQLQFLSIDNLDGTTVMTIGTSDSRLLFYIGNQMTYKQVIFDCQRYVKIFAIRYLQYQGKWVAIVIAWNADNTYSALLSVELDNFAILEIMNVKTDPDKPNFNISLIEIFKDYLFVGNRFGNISIYQIPNFGAKVGVMMHNNIVKDLHILEFPTQTGIMMHTMFILEQKGQNKEGSFAIYLLKN